MTREEAIANLKTIMFAYIEPPPTKEQIKIINDTFDMVIEALEQEPKTGQWISHREYCEKHDLIPSGLVTLEWCSNCDFGIDIDKRGWDRYKYCPHCGAKMSESEE